MGWRSTAGRLFRRAATPVPDLGRLHLADPEAARNPFPVYEALRRHGPVVFLPAQEVWLVLGHAAMKEALARPDCFSSAPHSNVDAVLLAADPPAHGTARRLTASFFGGEQVRSLEKIAEQAALARLKPRLDVVSEWGLPISREVTAGLIGFDEEALAALLAFDARPGSLAEGTEPLARFLDALAPRSRLYRELISSAGGALSRADAASLVRLMWIAGTITTERVLTRCVLQLATSSETASEVRDRPERLPRFIEECLRLFPPEHMFPRRTSCAATLQGIAIPAGATVQLCTSAANRDPERYEAPAEFRLDRNPADHLSFGSGPHVCLGAQLSRRLLRAALTVLLEVPGGFHLADPLETVPWIRNLSTLTPSRLEIVLPGS